VQHPPYTPHTNTPEELFQWLKSSSSGLRADEAQRRLRSVGLNTLEDEERSLISIFITQFASPIVWILIAAALLSFWMGQRTDSAIIGVILLINSVLGFVQEYRAESSIRALKKLTETHVRVIRNGLEALVSSDEIVPGDIVLITEGDLVPADLRLIESHALEADEAILTGESVPVSKNARSVYPAQTPPYERFNLLFSGTHVVKGSAKAIVTATGESTYLAGIAQSAREKSPHSPLTRSLGIFSKRLIVLLLGILGSVGVAGMIQGRTFADMTSIMIAELVSAVPEGLPIVVTLILALGAYRLSNHNVLVRHLPSVESLGSATVIATDKTGTVTEGKLSVMQSEVLDSQELRKCAALCNDATNSHGDPVDSALARWLGEDYETLRLDYPRVFYHPFDPKLRMMATVNENQHGERLYVKGAYESLKAIAQNSPDEIALLDRLHDSMASDGLRLLAFGISDEKWEEPEHWRVRIVGMIGFADAPKQNAAEAVRNAKEAGIRVIMITGDNAITAKAIAQKVGIWQEGETVLTGYDVSRLDDAPLLESLRQCTVIARALPEHKYRLVKLLQSENEIVVVTGDGVNDVPALKAADLGIAMGNGSEAAKSTAKMVITDNNLGVIVDAVRQGRIIAANLRKAVFYLLATCFDEILLISGAIMMGLPLPIHPTQILWVNIVTDGVIDKTFTMCREEGSVMHRSPQKVENQLFDRWQVLRIGWVSVVNASVTYAVFVHMLDSGFSYAAALTVSFCIIVTSQWVNGLLAQKEEEPFLYNLRSSLTINPAIWFGLGIGIVLQLIALYLVPHWFHALPPDAELLSYIGVATGVIFVLIEGFKWFEWAIKRRYRPKK